MTGSLRQLGLALFLAAPGLALRPVQDVQEMFQQGVELLQRGKDEEALAMFQKVLAANPSHEQAYELWKSTDHAIWLDILSKGGDYELISRRLQGLAEMGRTERKQDAEAIKGLLKKVKDATDVPGRRTALRQLAAEHGEFAVEFMLPTLANQADDDARVLYMHALTEMATDVVPPLCQALHSSDPYLRRNVALTLGYIGDPRAAGPLGAVAARDDNESVRAAAAEALKKCGGGDPVANLVKLGESYYYRRAEVLDAHPHAAGTWGWKDEKLVFNPCPPAIYPDEMARKAFAAALALEPGSAPALQGLAGSSLCEAERLAAMAVDGTDIGAMAAVLEMDVLTARLAGLAALDGALATAVAAKDPTASAALCAALDGLAVQPTPGLTAALLNGDGATRTRAALTLGNGAVLSRSKAAAEVVTELGNSAAREAVRMIALFDADAARANAIASAFDGAGILVQQFDKGAAGLAMLHRVSGLDAIIVADKLPDLTAAQVIFDIAEDPKLAKAPVYLITADVEGAKGVWGEKVAGYLTGEAEVAAVVDALAAVEGDRAKAVAMAAESAAVLAELARGSSDLAPVLPSLRKAAQSQPDPVAIEAMRALAVAGDSAAADDLANIAADGSRSEAARTQAATAAGRAFARGVQASEVAVTALRGVVGSDAPIGLRAAAARALGTVPMSPADRAKLVTGDAPAQQM